MGENLGFRFNIAADLKQDLKLNQDTRAADNFTRAFSVSPTESALSSPPLVLFESQALLKSDFRKNNQITSQVTSKLTSGEATSSKDLLANNSLTKDSSTLTSASLLKSEYTPEYNQEQRNIVLADWQTQIVAPELVNSFNDDTYQSDSTFEWLSSEQGSKGELGRSKVISDSPTTTQLNNPHYLPKLTPFQLIKEAFVQGKYPQVELVYCSYNCDSDYNHYSYNHQYYNSLPNLTVPTKPANQKTDASDSQNNSQDSSKENVDNVQQELMFV